MFNKNLAKALLSSFTLLSVAMSTNAATPSAQQVIQVTLPSLIDITTECGTTTASINPDNGNLSNSLTPTFGITTNGPQTLYLKANASSATNDNEIAFCQKNNQVYVLLAHIGQNSKPTSDAIQNCKSQSTTASNNANVIAYPVSGVSFSNESATATYSSSSNQYEISVGAGTTNAITTINQTPMTNTYSYSDTSGTYQAILTLSNTSL